MKDWPSTSKSLPINRLVSIAITPRVWQLQSRTAGNRTSSARTDRRHQPDATGRLSGSVGLGSLSAAGNPDGPRLLTEYLQSLKTATHAPSLAAKLKSDLPEFTERLTVHVASLNLPVMTSGHSRSGMRTMQSPDEIFDICDENDRVIGQARRADVHAQKLLHRAVHIWVFLPDGRLVTQRRSASKDEYPLALTSSASGHLDSGEDYQTAAVRELGEELGLRGVDLLFA